MVEELRALARQAVEDEWSDDDNDSPAQPTPVQHNLAPHTPSAPPTSQLSSSHPLLSMLQAQIIPIISATSTQTCSTQAAHLEGNEGGEGEEAQPQQSLAQPDVTQGSLPVPASHT